MSETRLTEFKEKYKYNSWIRLNGSIASILLMQWEAIKTVFFYNGIDAKVTLPGALPITHNATIPQSPYRKIWNKSISMNNIKFKENRQVFK